MRIVSFICLVSIVSCNIKEIKSSGITLKTIKDTIVTAAPTQDSVLEKNITDTLFKLAFVKKSNAYIDSFSNHEHGIAFIVSPFKKGDAEIFVQAGYNGDLRFETYYQFYVNPIDLSIKIYDPVTDQKLSVNEYINQKK